MTRLTLNSHLSLHVLFLAFSQVLQKEALAFSCWSKILSWDHRKLNILQWADGLGSVHRDWSCHSEPLSWKSLGLSCLQEGILLQILCLSQWPDRLKTWVPAFLTTCWEDRLLKFLYRFKSCFSVQHEISFQLKMLTLGMTHMNLSISASRWDVTVYSKTREWCWLHLSPSLVVLASRAPLHLLLSASPQELGVAEEAGILSPDLIYTWWQKEVSM